MSTKNIFAELGFENDVATAETWRSDLARVIRDYFKRSQTSQTAFAKSLNIKQSVVSRIINGRLGGLSIEFLLRLCVRLGTRGIATWGPTPDEARVTIEIQNVLGTQVSVTQATLNVTESPVEVQLRSLAAERTTGSRAGLVRLQ